MCICFSCVRCVSQLYLVREWGGWQKTWAWKWQPTQWTMTMWRTWLLPPIIFAFPFKTNILVTMIFLPISFSGWWTGWQSRPILLVTFPSHTASYSSSPLPSLLRLVILAPSFRTVLIACVLPFLPPTLISSPFPSWRLPHSFLLATPPHIPSHRIISNLLPVVFAFFYSPLSRQSLSSPSSLSSWSPCETSVFAIQAGPGITLTDVQPVNLTHGFMTLLHLRRPVPNRASRASPLLWSSMIFSILDCETLPSKISVCMPIIGAMMSLFPMLINFEKPLLTYHPHGPNSPSYSIFLTTMTTFWWSMLMPFSYAMIFPCTAPSAKWNAITHRWVFIFIALFRFISLLLSRLNFIHD